MTRESTTAKYLTNDWISFCLTFTPSIFISTWRNFSPISLTPNRDIRVDCLLNVYLRTRPARIRRRFNRSMAKRTQKKIEKVNVVIMRRNNTAFLDVQPIKRRRRGSKITRHRERIIYAFVACTTCALRGAFVPPSNRSRGSILLPSFGVSTLSLSLSARRNRSVPSNFDNHISPRHFLYLASCYYVWWKSGGDRAGN